MQRLHRLPTSTAIQIRMHHLADDRPRTDDRHLHDEVVEADRELWEGKTYMTLPGNHVPLATTSTDPMNPGMFHNHDTHNELLPMTHLTATTVLGGTRGDDEVGGQTLATTVGSALLMKRPQEERMLVLGLGINRTGEMGKSEFDAVVGLILECL